MAVLSDHQETADICRARYDIQADRALINVFRVGKVPLSKRPRPARLSSADLIVEELDG